MVADLLLALDAGTTSVRAIAFTLTGEIAASCGRPIIQHYPQPGWVEHDAAEIWRASRDCLIEVADRVGAPRIAAIGITNQRETVVLWDRETGEPLAPAIVWQDRRTADVCAALKAGGHEAAVQAKTGLLLDPYFSATKMRWALDNWPAVAAAAEAGTLLAGTVESWLIWKLSAGERHVTDATNASRTLLMDLATCEWDAELLNLFGVPTAILPQIVDCAGRWRRRRCWAVPRRSLAQPATSRLRRSGRGACGPAWSRRRMEQAVSCWPMPGQSRRCPNIACCQR